MDDQRLDARYGLDRQGCDVAVAAVLAQQGDRLPQGEVRFVGPCLCEVPGEQRPALGRTLTHQFAQQGCGLGDVG